jgi:hypothetical protein
VTGDTGQVCADLASWHNHVAELIDQPDRGGTTPSRSKPRSRPPWNPAVANAIYDTHAAIRETEQELRHDVTRRPAHLCRRPGWSDGNTTRALEAIPKLAAAADTQLTEQAIIDLNRLLASILQLPAIDLEQRPRILPCPRCTRKMLRYWENSDEVACYGCNQKASISIGYISGEPDLTWADGWVGT